MLKRILPIVCLSMLLVGCGNTQKPKLITDKDSGKEIVDINMDDTSKEKYSEVGEKALESCEDTDATTRYIVKSQAIYDAMLQNEGDAIIKNIKVSDEELNSYVANPNNPQLVKTVVLEDSQGKEWTYYITKEDPLVSNDIKEGDDFLGSKVKNVHDTTDDEKKAKAKENIISGILTDTVNKYTKDCMNLRSDK